MEKEFGVMVKAKGKYYPDKRMATEREPALGIEIASPSQEALNKATAYIKSVIEKGPPVSSMCVVSQPVNFPRLGLI